jgi:hypothetical protein
MDKEKANKVGRPRIFKDPEELWQVFEEYVEHNKKNPRIKYELSGRTGEVVPIPLQPPLTLEAFNLFIFYKGLGDGARQYFENTGKAYDEFLGVTTRIRECVKSEQVQGGMLGLYNPNLTARLNGLTDKQEIDQKVTSNQLEVVIKRMDK